MQLQPVDSAPASAAAATLSSAPCWLLGSSGPSAVSFGSGLRKGDLADFLDNKKWLLTEVLDTDSDRMFVHYIGWSRSRDEWIRKDSARLQPPRTHTRGYTGPQSSSPFHGQVLLDSGAEHPNCNDRRLFRKIEHTTPLSIVGFSGESATAYEKGEVALVLQGGGTCLHFAVQGRPFPTLSALSFPLICSSASLLSPPQGHSRSTPFTGSHHHCCTRAHSILHWMMLLFVQISSEPLPRSMLRRCATAIAPRTLVSARPTVTLRRSLLSSPHATGRLVAAAPCSLIIRSMSAVPYSKPPLLPPSLHDRSQPLQVFPALLPATDHAPATFPFGRIALPAAGVFFATALSYVSVNQSPLMAGHVLVMPRSNQARVKELAEEQITDLWLSAQHVARVFEDRFKAEAMTFAIQDGVEAGQKIPCVHIHLIPRHPADLMRKDDIYELIEKNVPASLIAAGSESTPSAAGVPNVNTASSVSVEAPPAAAAAPDRGALRESLDDAKRVIRTRAEQAVEARGFAEWMKEAGVPAFLSRQDLQIVQ